MVNIRKLDCNKLEAQILGLVIWKREIKYEEICNKCEDGIKNTFSCNAIAKASDASPFAPASADSVLGLVHCKRVIRRKKN